MTNGRTANQRLPAAPADPRPLVAFAGARALYLGPALDLSPHRNAAFTLAIGLDAPMTLRLGDGRGGWEPMREGRLLAIPAGRLHHLVAQGRMAFLYLDRLGDDVEALADADPDALHACIARQDPAALRRWSLDTWRNALGLPEAAPGDPRAAKVAARLFADPCALPSLAEAARAATLSPSRFHALFRAQAGVPFRRYRLWRRMGHVMAALASGANLTVAAHEAGFASSAHFSDQFRRLFGLKPSALVALGPEIRAEAV